VINLIKSQKSPEKSQLFNCQGISSSSCPYRAWAVPLASRAATGPRSWEEPAWYLGEKSEEEKGWVFTLW